MFQTIIQKLQYAAERAVVWCLNRCLTEYSRVVAREVARIDAQAAKFESDAKQVAEALVQACMKLDSRLKAIESKGGE